MGSAFKLRGSEMRVDVVPPRLGECSWVLPRALWVHNSLFNPERRWSS